MKNIILLIIFIFLLSSHGFALETGIEFQSQLPGVKIYINNEYMGETIYVDFVKKNILRVNLPPNTYKVHFEHQDYIFSDVSITVYNNGYSIHVLSFSEKKIISEGSTITDSEAVAKVGKIVVRSNPSRAIVELDKIRINDLTDCIISNVPQGKHQLKIFFQPQKFLTIEVEVFENSETSVTANFISQQINYEVIFNKSKGNNLIMIPVYIYTILGKTRNLTDKFFISKYEITQDLYFKIMQDNPSEFLDNQYQNKLPVERVSWNDAIDFCNSLSESEGLDQVYDFRFLGDANYITPIIYIAKFKKKGYRLPTEYEWEYAASGGCLSKGFRYPGSNDLNEIAWWSENSQGKTHPIGQKVPNELGIYDMFGNVAEYIWNSYIKDVNVTGGEERNEEDLSCKIKGGGFDNDLKLIKTSSYWYGNTNVNYNSTGIRIVIKP